MRRLFTALLSLTLLVAPGTVLAHGDTTSGEISVIIGMVDEPVVVGQKSGIEVGLTSAAGDPVEGATLTATVSIEGASKRFDLEPAYGRPGWYKVDFIPTVPGAYTVALEGEAGGETIALEITAGPETFSVVRPAGEVAFPVALPDPNATAVTAKQAADSAGIALILAIVAIALAIGGSLRRKS